MVGTEAKPFAGTFDGGGHTLTIEYNNSESYVAPFRYIDGATIKNLRTAGTIKSNNIGVGGIAGNAQGKTSNFFNCQSAVNMIWTGTTDSYLLWGGLLGRMTVNVNFDNCAFYGSMTGTASTDYFIGMCVGGFVGGALNENANAQITNCLMAGKIKSPSNQNFPSNNTFSSYISKIKNSYWIDEYITSQEWFQTEGTKLSVADSGLLNGAIAYKLQGDHNTQLWGQTIGVDTVPQLTDNAQKHVYRASFTYNGDTVFSSYANPGQNFPLPSLGDLGIGPAKIDYSPKPADSDITITITDLQKDNDGYYLISSADDWNSFADCNVSGNYRLTNNIGTVKTMVGTSDKPFSGIFDGQGYTITVDYNSTEQYIAPFRFVSGVTIKNLRTAGKIVTTDKYVGGIVAQIKDNDSYFYGCQSSVRMTYNGYGFTDKFWGGIVGTANANVTFENCLFDGALLDNTDEIARKTGGFIAVSEQSVNIKNSLVTATIKSTFREGNIGDNATFARATNKDNINIENCYYIGDNITRLDQSYPNFKQGTNIKKENDIRIKSGALAYLLQANQSGNHWGQQIGKDAKPKPTTDQEMHVFRARFFIDSDTISDSYANYGKEFALPWKDDPNMKVDFTPIIAEKDTDVVMSEKIALVIPTSDEFTINAFIDNKALDNGDYVNLSDEITYRVLANTGYYLLSDSLTTIKAYRVLPTPVLLKMDDDGFVHISTTSDWDKFAKYSKEGNYKLTADIGNVKTMVGTDRKPFSGIFDGQEHTMTIDLNTHEEYTAPFRYISGATIKNLRTAGTINSNSIYAGGIVAQAQDSASYFYNCRSSVVMNWLGVYNCQICWGGIIGITNANVNFENCIFDGSILDEEHSQNRRCTSTGGFIGQAEKNVSIKNSLMTGKIESNSSTDISFSNATFVRAKNYDNIKVENSYWIPENIENVNNKYIYQGTRISKDDERLKNGVITYTLQGGQKPQYWGQTIGSDDLPILTSDADKHVLENSYDGDTVKVYDNYIVFNENKNNKANIAAYKDVTANVKLIRKFANGWNTLVLPFSLTTDDVENAFGNDAQVAYFTNKTLNTIELNTSADGNKAIEANTPVLIKPAKAISDIGNLTFLGKTIECVSEAKITGANGIEFIGSYDSLYTVKDGEYFINGTNLWRSKGKTTIKGTRCYFTVPESAAGAKIMLIINDDGTTTGISEIRNDDSDALNQCYEVYTLSGQKIANSLEDARKAGIKQGVYLMNGKKIVINK